MPLDLGDSLDSCSLTLYQIAVNQADWTESGVSARLPWGEDQLSAAINRLAALGLLVSSTETPSGWCALPPQAAIRELARDSRRQLEAALAVVEHSQSALAELLEKFAPVHAGPSGDIALAGSGPALASLLEEATRAATSDILSLHPAPAPTPDQITDGRSRNHAVLSRGVSMRTIYQLSSAALPYMGRHLRDLADTGARIRTAPTLPVRLIVVDEVLAVISTSPLRQGREAVVTRSTPLVRVLRQIFEHHWDQALDFLPGRDGGKVADSAIPGESEKGALSVRQLEVLRMLAAGLTDDVISRKLGLSERTVRRIIADLMVLCDAQSRFQAGINIARLGWVTRQPGPRQDEEGTETGHAL